MGKILYNDNEPFIAEWLAELVREGHLPDGDLTTASIRDLQPADLAQYTQVHLFAGIGGWPLALQMAGWPADREVWTGSCPCQPFSAAGKQKGVSDDRHLWPDMLRLIAGRRPVTIFGEQVPNAIGHGWLDGVFSDLEAENYTCGAVVLGAHSVGAPHIRQRLYWVADAHGRQPGDGDVQRGGEHRQQPQDDGFGERVADAERDSGNARRAATEPGESVGAPPAGTRVEPGRRGVPDGLHNTTSPRQQSARPGAEGQARDETRLRGFERGRHEGWGSAWINCLDGKARRVEPGIFPLAHGIPNRVGTLRGAGNAIVPQVAAAFIRAYLDSEN